MLRVKRNLEFKSEGFAIIKIKTTFVQYFNIRLSCHIFLNWIGKFLRLEEM